MNTNNPHKHAAVIKAWADGAAIEYRPSTDQTFEVLACPYFDGPGEYRVKTAPVKHKWQDCIDAQAAGKKMQLKGPCQKEWEDAHTMLRFNDAETLYRVRPETVSYRLAIVRGQLFPDTFHVESYNSHFGDGLTEMRPEFVRWLGPRQTVKV